MVTAVQYLRGDGSSIEMFRDGNRIFPLTQAQVEGSPRLFVYASSYFDPWTNNPSSADQQAMRDLYEFMVVFSPYFDSRLSWFPNGYEYIDMYGVKPSFPRYTSNPEWILEDINGDDLYLDYACSGGTCPQWAGDVGNPAFRADMIANEFTDAINLGYPGFHIDDLNMRPSTTTGDGNFEAPVDPRTGQIMLLDDWRNYVATFMEEIRAAFPTAIISTNPIWYLDSTTFNDVNIDRQIEATDIFHFERGINDGGLTGGSGTYSLVAHFNMVDRIHDHGGVAAWRDETGTTEILQEYQLAAYLMANNGSDYVSTEVAEHIAHDTVWPGWLINIGAALGPRTYTSGLFRREFENGTVLLNEPSNSTQNVSITGNRIDGTPVTSVSLPESSGVVVLT